MSDSRVQILGIPFFVGTADEAVARMTQTGGFLVVPAAPALVRLERDEIYRHAMVHADLAIPDSGLMVLSWRMVRGQVIPRVSGLAYLRALAAAPGFAIPNSVFFVLPSESAREKLLAWAGDHQPSIDRRNTYIAPMYGASVEDRELVAVLNSQRLTHIVIAIGNGPQEKLGYFLRENLAYRPAIHCIGAALGFLTGDQVAIPNWADRFYFGWLFRLLSQPRVFVPRLARALRLPWLVLRFGGELPALRAHK